MSQLDEYQTKAVNTIKDIVNEDGNRTLPTQNPDPKRVADDLLELAFDRLDENDIPDSWRFLHKQMNELRTDDNGCSYERKYVRSHVAYFGGVEEDFKFSDDPKVAVLIDAFNVLTQGERLDVDD